MIIKFEVTMNANFIHLYFNPDFTLNQMFSSEQKKSCLKKLRQNNVELSPSALIGSGPPKFSFSNIWRGWT